MKAEHRHELKTNALAEWLGNLPAWANQNLRTIIYAAVVAVLVLASSIYYWIQKNSVAEREQNNLTTMVSQLPQEKAYIAQKQLEGQDNAYMLFQLNDQLDSISKNASNNAVAAMALIKSAEVLRTELHFRFGAVSQQDITTQIGKAKDYYTKALDILKRSPNLTLEAMAKNGLGLCEEELGNPDAARKLYQEVATGAAYEGTAPTAAAKQRLMVMDSFPEKIVLKPMPKSAIKAMPQVVSEPNTPVQN
jgi:hypothetical protein